MPAGQEYIASGGDTTILDVYPWSSTSGFGARLSDPASMPAGISYGIDINQTGSLIAATDGTSASQNVYPLTSIIGTQFSKPAITAPTDLDVKFSPASTEIVGSGSSSPFLHAWAWSSGWGTKFSNPSSVPTQYAKNIAFSPNGNFLAVNNTTLRYPAAYGWSSSGFGTRYTTGSTQLPTSTTQYSIDFSPTSDAVAVGFSRSPYFYVFRFSGSGYGTRYTSAATLPGSLTTDFIWCLKFAPNNAYIALGGSASPYVYIYGWSYAGGIGTKVSNPSDIPSVYPSSVGWSADSDAVSFGPYFTYPFTAGAFGTRYATPGTPGSGGDVAFGLQASAAAAYSLTANVGSFSLTNNSANTILGRSISSNVTNVSGSGQNALLKKTTVSVASVTNVSCSGQNVLLKKTTVSVASVTNVSCSGQNAELSRSSAVSASAYQMRMANLALLNVDANGNYIDKKTAPISAMLSSRVDNLILPNQTNLNSVGYPTLKTYLYLEASQGFILSHINQSQIITVKN